MVNHIHKVWLLFFEVTFQKVLFFELSGEVVLPTPAVSSWWLERLFSILNLLVRVFHFDDSIIYGLIFLFPLVRVFPLFDFEVEFGLARLGCWSI